MVKVFDVEVRSSLVPNFSPVAHALWSSLVMTCFSLDRSQSPLSDSGAVSRIRVWIDCMHAGREWRMCITILCCKHNITREEVDHLSISNLFFSIYIALCVHYQWDTVVKSGEGKGFLVFLVLLL